MQSLPLRVSAVARLVANSSSALGTVQSRYISNVSIIGGGQMGSGIAQVKYFSLLRFPRTPNVHTSGILVSEIFLFSSCKQVAAGAGNSVNLIDINEDVLNKAKKGITKSLERVAKSKFKVKPPTHCFVFSECLF